MVQKAGMYTSQLTSGAFWALRFDDSEIKVETQQAPLRCDCGGTNNPSARTNMGQFLQSEMQNLIT